MGSNTAKPNTATNDPTDCFTKKKDTSQKIGDEISYRSGEESTDSGLSDVPNTPPVSRAVSPESGSDHEDIEEEGSEENESERGHEPEDESEDELIDTTPKNTTTRKLKLNINDYSYENLRERLDGVIKASKASASPTIASKGERAGSSIRQNIRKAQDDKEAGYFKSCTSQRRSFETPITNREALLKRKKNTTDHESKTTDPLPQQAAISGCKLAQSYITQRPAAKKRLTAFQLNKAARDVERQPKASSAGVTAHGLVSSKVEVSDDIDDDQEEEDSGIDEQKDTILDDAKDIEPRSRHKSSCGPPKKSTHRRYLEPYEFSKTLQCVVQDIFWLQDTWPEFLYQNFKGRGMNKIEAEKKAIEKRATARKYFDDEFNKHGWVRKRKREDNEEDEKDNGVDDNKTKTLRAKKLKEGNDNHLDSTRRDSDDDESGDDNRPNQSAAPKAGRKKTSTTTTSVPKKPLRANNRTGASSKNSNGAKSKTGTWVPEEQNTHESTKDQMKQRGKKPRRVSHGGWVWQTKDLEAGSDAEWQDLRTSEEEREARAGLKAQTEADSLERKAVREKKVREAWKKDQMKRDQAKGETMNWEGRRVSRVDIVMIDRP